MARKSRTSARKSVRCRVVEYLGRLSMVKVCVLTSVGLALLSAVILGAWTMRKHVEKDERFSFDQWTLDVGEMPWWVTPEIEDDIALSHHLDGGGVSLFDADAVDKLREMLERSPWVRSATDIQLFYPTSERPGRIRATLVLRTPIAMVQLGHECFLADVEGRRLGEGYSPDAQTWFRVPRVIGIRGGQDRPEPGETWQASDVVQGIGVARVLWENRVLDEFPGQSIDAIDVSNVSGRVDRRTSEVDLRCGSKTLRWGRSPYAADSQVMPVRSKLANLRRVLRQPEFAHLRVVSLYTTPMVGS